MTSSIETQISLQNLVNPSLFRVFDLLNQFSRDSLLNDKINIAFGDNTDATNFQAAWADSNFGHVPPIEILTVADINGANGAFSATTGKIYLAQEFIEANADNLDDIASVLLEEYGHYLDSQINVTDSPGDEGDIFSRLVQGNSINASELLILKAEDDTATVILDGQVVQIEQNINTITFNENTSRFNTPNFSIDPTQKNFRLHSRI